jgi:hypothetical protein
VTYSSEEQFITDTIFHEISNISLAKSAQVILPSFDELEK